MPKADIEESSYEKLLYEMGITLFYDLNMIDSAIVKFENINKKFPESEYAYKSLKLLNEINPAFQWTDEINSRFSDYIFNESEKKEILKLKKEAWLNLDSDVQSCIDEFMKIYNDYCFHQ